MQTANPLDDAIQRAGGLAEFAKRMSESMQTVSNWRSRGVPAGRCAAIELAFGVDRRLFRPHDWRDYWPELVGKKGAPKPPADTPAPTKAEQGA